MSAPTWEKRPIPEIDRPGIMGWVRVICRAAPILALIAPCFLLLLALRAPERALCGASRPITPNLTRWVCRASLWLAGLSYQRSGAPMTAAGAVVANHASWLDIFALNAGQNIYFVSKAEVEGWPGIGWLAQGTGTLFIKRDRSEARAQTELFQRRLLAGHRLLFFPEGTSTDGRAVIPFRSTLFAAFFAPGLRDLAHIQPVSVIYRAPDGQPAWFYGWWGDMEFGAHLIQTLAAKRRGTVTVVYHPPLKVTDFPDRKTLAAEAERCVREGHSLHLQ